MKYRQLGKTGLHVSVIGLGTMQLGGEWGQHFSHLEVNKIISAAQDCGINLIDTAECYGDHQAETLLGYSIRAQRKNRILATKFGHRFLAPFRRENHWKPNDVKRQLEASLKALQTDYVDIYQFHSGGLDELNNEELWAMLSNEMLAGKIRPLGLSVNHQLAEKQIQIALSFGVSEIQVRFNRLENDAAKNIIPFCLGNNLGVLARSPLASSFLTGKYLTNVVFSNHDIRSQIPKEKLRDTINFANHVLQTEVPDGISKRQWALKWCLNNPGVTSIITGCKNITQVIENAMAVNFVDGDIASS